MDIRKIIKEEINESIKLPIEVGDTVYMGKWKNKKVVIKDIEWNEKGDLMINGKPALKMRIPKKAKKVVKESDFEWTDGVIPMEDQDPVSWIGKSFGYSDKLKSTFSPNISGIRDGDETYTIDGISENGKNLQLTNHHPTYGKRKTSTSVITFKSVFIKGDWVWV